MVPVTSLLVLACAIAINGYAMHSDACGSIKIGQTSGKGVQLAKTTLQPGTADWEVVIPPIPQCPNGPIGVSAIVCDVDVLPTAQFLDKSLILVRRVGNLQGPGSVTPTIYCAEQWPQNQPWLPNNQPWLSQTQWSNSQHTTRAPQNLWNQEPQPLWNQAPQPLWNQKQQGLILIPH